MLQAGEEWQSARRRAGVPVGGGLLWEWRGAGCPCLPPSPRLQAEARLLGPEYPPCVESDLVPFRVVKYQE